MDKKNNKLQKFDPDKLPAFFKDLSEEQQSLYLERLALDDTELRKIANEKIIDSKIAERDMVTDLEYMKQIETENKVVNIKREYQTGSGKMEVNIKGGDKKILIPVLIVIGLIVIAVLIAIFQ